MGRKWEVRYVTYSSMVPFVSVALSEWGLGDLGPEPSREKSAVCNPNVTRDGLAHQYTTQVGNWLTPSLAITGSYAWYPISVGLLTHLSDGP